MTYSQYAVVQYKNQLDIQVLEAGTATVTPAGKTAKTGQGLHKAKVVAVDHVFFSSKFPYPEALNPMDPYGYFLSIAVL